MSQILGHLHVPRAAAFAVLGNHDYGPGWSHLEIADDLSHRLNRIGITVLRNDQAIVDGLTVIGVDDLWSGRLDLESMSKSLTAAGAKMVLCHNPDAVDLPDWSDYQGWILAGHTHGGQCKPPFLPPPLLPVSNRRYVAGEYDLWDGRRLYISRGVGHLLRGRFNVRPEITVFDLVEA